MKLETLSIRILTEAYNLFADKKIKKFSSKEEAVRRTAEILKTHKHKIVVSTDDDCGYTVVSTTKKSDAPAKPRTEYERHLRIEVRVDNPKRRNSRARERFALYRDGMTVGEYLDACVKHDGRRARPAYRYLADLHWDETRAFITVWTQQLFDDFVSDRTEDDTADLEAYRPAPRQ